LAQVAQDCAGNLQLLSRGLCIGFLWECMYTNPVENDVSADRSNADASSPPKPTSTTDCSEGFLLAGRPLQPPRIHTTRWREFQTFSVAEDPDRTREPWAAPAFARDLMAAAVRAQQTTVEELKLPRYLCAGPNSFARIVHGVLDEWQCEDLLAIVNKKGFTPALLNIGDGNQQLRTQARDGLRVIVDNTELADWLLAALVPHLPAEVGPWELVDLNERLRFLCYTPGMEFKAHLDSEYERPADERGPGSKSKVTVQLYLHSLHAAYGGATTFFPGSGDDLPCQPLVGSVLLFTQDLEHAGSLLTGGLKYTMRTEAMYRRRHSYERR